jgi:hypothetical protein
MIFKFITNNTFHFIVLLGLILILFISHLNENLDGNSKHFINVYAIKVEENEDQFFTINFNKVLNYDNLNNYEIIQITQLDNEIKRNNSKNDNNSKISNSSESSNANNTNTKNKNTTVTNVIKQLTSISNHTFKDFNFVAVGDWDCTSETDDTVENIIKQNPELVVALGDLSYNGDAECWLELIEPFAEKTKIVIGNHELDSSELLEDYMDYFKLKEQYYSFNYENVHFLVLSTETDFDEDSEQYQFAVDDLQKYSKDPSIDWIVVSFHKQVYSSGSSPEDEEDFREIYHSLFEKYKVDLALQGHLHAYERMYPITFNSDDEDEPIVRDTNPNTYANPNGTIFVTVGTGGAHDMELSSLDDFSAVGLDGDFGILDITIENSSSNNSNKTTVSGNNINTNNTKVLAGRFIENEDDDEFKILDEFKIIKTN